ncbi:MAG: SpoIIE family protein phosphatase [Leptospiraceae bacterium]|nr:SpoIIE family protein phosphatase [Leptospiraceae bacterium]
MNQNNLSIPEGEWEFRKGFEQSWLQEKKPSDSWTAIQFPISLPKNDKFQEFASYEGWVTFRKKLDPQFVARLVQNGSASFVSGHISDVSYFYINQTRFGQLGRAEPYQSGSYSNLIADIPVQAFQKGDNYLYIAIYRKLDRPIRFKDRFIRLGISRDVYTEFYRGEMLQAALLLLYFSVGLYHLLLFARRRQETYNLFFGLFGIVISLYWSFRMHSRDVLWGDLVSLRHSTEFSLLYMIGPTMMAFISDFFYRRVDLFTRAYAAIWGLLVIITWLVPFGWKQFILTSWQLHAPVILIYIILRVVYAAWKLRSQDALLLLVGILMLFGAAGHDIWASIKEMDAVHYASFAFPAFILGIAAILANRFVRVHSQVEELNRNLEKKVQQRTLKLQNTLNEVQVLKEQQDGDYFLTSLLIRPLTGSYSESENCSIEMFMRQKKQFRFRKWESEIGGDLCAAHSIILHGRRYTAVINGDAMGKSIQGAGGALVLGTVFKSVIARTQMSQEAMQRYPERWLRECFIELQNVFESFDGSMLISAVIGLVDDENGYFYFINAEHPWVVLYRDNEARFIEDQNYLYKIGTSGLQGKLIVKTWHMQPRDILIMGSDGRDDIVLGEDENGYRVINEDETLFLRMVEQANSQLEQIMQLTLKQGTLSDDFTLLRIAWQEDAPLLMNQTNQDQVAQKERLADLLRQQEYRSIITEATDSPGKLPPEAVKVLGQAYFGLRQYKPAAEALFSYSIEHPWDLDGLYKTSYYARLAHDLETAIDFGIRVKMRDPDHVHNLINLADCWRQKGNPDRALKLLNQALQVDATNKSALKLKNLLERVPEQD